MKRRHWLALAALGAAAPVAWLVHRPRRGAHLVLYADEVMTQIVAENAVASLALDGVPPRAVAARWRGYLSIEAAGDYEFFLEGSARSRMTVNGIPVLDRWDDFAGNERSKYRRLARGMYRLVLEAHELSPSSWLRIDWRGPRHERQPIASGLRRG